MKAIALLALSIALEAGFLFTLAAPAQAPSAARTAPAAAHVQSARAAGAPAEPLRRS
jgi:hypothetical protein